METKVQVLGFQGNEIIVREGAALEQEPPVKIELSGNILSVGNFLKERYPEKKGKSLQEVDKEKAIVVVDEEGMKIKLSLDPENTYGTTVTGSLEFTPELKQFFINETKQFTREELVKIFRFNKRHFDSADQFDKLLAAYQKMQIKTASELSQENDTRGNKALNFVKNVDSAGIPLEFILNIPIFKGFGKERFRVEICLDATDASVRFWFESVELAELIDVRKEEIFEKQLESCRDFVIIYK